MKIFKKALIFSIPILALSAALLISIYPDLHHLEITPKGRLFPLIHNHITDYYYYLSLMRQGFEGKWLLTSRMTPETFPPAFAQTFFAVLGQFSRLLNAPLFMVYFASRIFSGAALMVIVIYTVRKIFKANAEIILACFLVFFATGFWIAVIKSGRLEIGQFLAFWTRLDPIMRTTFLPHHIASTVLGLLSVAVLADALEKKDIKRGIAAGALGFLSGLIYFATMINIIGGVVLGVFIWLGAAVISRFDPLQAKVKIHIRPVIPFFFISGLSLLYLFALSLRGGFPWSSYGNVGEHFIFGATVWEYMASLGPAFLLSLIGMVKIVKDRRWLPKLLLGWAVFPFAGLFMLTRIVWKFGDVYYLEAASYIPWGILAVYGWRVLREKVLDRYKYGAVIFTAVLFLYFIPPLVSSFNREMDAYTPYYYNQYIPSEVMTGIKWLDDLTPSRSVVLAGGYFGAIIPAFSHNRVVYGHPSGTYNAGEKIADVNLFFSQKDTDSARNILRKYNVSYVFYALDTDQPTQDFLNVLPLSIVFENGTVKIFKVEK